MNQNTTTPATAGLDFSAIARAATPPLLLWTMVIGFASWRGYPGAACMTPMAWLLGCWVGLKCADRSRSAPGWRVLEAFIAGDLLGLEQGVLFSMVQATLLTPMDALPDEVQKALLLSVGVLVIGTLLNGLISAETARVYNCRRLHISQALCFTQQASL